MPSGSKDIELALHTRSCFKVEFRIFTQAWPLYALIDAPKRITVRPDLC